MSGFLDDRRRGAEEAFFAKQNEQLRVELRGGQQLETSRDGLSAASGLRDERVLDGLTALNVGVEGAAVLALTPLVAVAWADGEVTEKEREALLAAARDAGMSEGDPGYKLFAGWLDNHPPASLMTRWKEFAASLLADMPADTAAAFRDEVLERSQRIATAAGGFLGFGSVSDAEEALLNEIRATLGG